LRRQPAVSAAASRWSWAAPELDGFELAADEGQDVVGAIGGAVNPLFDLQLLIAVFIGGLTDNVPYCRRAAFLLHLERPVAEADQLLPAAPGVIGLGRQR